MNYSKKQKKKIKKKVKQISFRINELLHKKLSKSSFVTQEVILYLVFGKNTKQKNRFYNNKFIDYRLSQLVRLEKILNVNIIIRDIYEN